MCPYVTSVVKKTAYPEAGLDRIITTDLLSASKCTCDNFGLSETPWLFPRQDA